MSVVKSIGAYDVLGRDRQELFGDDLLVNVLWEGQIFITVPTCCRVPRSMTWGEFRAQVLDPWAGADPDYRPDAAGDWRLDETPIEPRPEQTLAELGVVHKGLIRFRVA